ncbi:MAG: PDZ domain-containing protein [Actinomycetota bacterium]|nr:PDZ domain-containing protein [Actinomycetota bacterium]
MSNPRHLWSGDWELDSAAARDELAKRRAQVEEPPETPVAGPPPRAQPSMAARTLARLVAQTKALRRLMGSVRQAVAGSPGVSRQLRIALLVALVALVSAAVAFAVTTMLVNSTGSASANSAHAWLGIDVSGSSNGIMVTDVVPAGPAGKAGLQRGDLITAINNQPVGTVDAVNAALAGLHSGDTVVIQFTRGRTAYTIQTTLAPRPPGHP